MSRKDEVLKTLEEQARAKRLNQLSAYQPLVKDGVSRQLEFHTLSGLHTESCFGAGNQLGKTFAGAAQAAIFLTGRYPDWWPGRRWDRPTVGTVLGTTSEAVRDTCQRLLLGKITDDIGTGLIPAGCLDRNKMIRSHGVGGVYDVVPVKHVSGKWSELKFKSYEKGREKLQGDTLDWFWCDEEAPEDVYEELLARITATRGMGWLTFTPLKGITGIVSKFYDEPGRPRLVTMRIDESPLYTAEMIEEQKRKYPEYQWQARLYGEPVQGEGAVFTYLPETITVDDFPLPDHWSLLWGLDFGIAHPFAAVLLAWDRDADVLYVVRCIRMKDALPIQHCEAMKAAFNRRGNIIPAAWPQDGTQRREFEGQLTPLRKVYASYGQKMCDVHAQFDDGSNSTELGIQEMSTRFATGRLKVFRSCVEWFQEYGRYRRKDGLLLKLNDDLMSATRVGVMMRRKARPFDVLTGKAQGQHKVQMAIGANPDWW